MTAGLAPSLDWATIRADAELPPLELPMTATRIRFSTGHCLITWNAAASGSTNTACSSETVLGTSCRLRSGTASILVTLGACVEEVWGD